MKKTLLLVTASMGEYNCVYCTWKFNVINQQLFSKYHLRCNNTIFLIYQQNFPDISTQFSRFINTIFQIYQHNFPDLSTQFSRYINTIFQIYQHNFPVYQHNFPVYQHNFPDIPTQFSRYINTIFQLYQHSFPDISTQFSIYINTIFQIYQHNFPDILYELFPVVKMRQTFRVYWVSHRYCTKGICRKTAVNTLVKKWVFYLIRKKNSFEYARTCAI